MSASLGLLIKKYTRQVNIELLEPFSRRLDQICGVLIDGLKTDHVVNLETVLF